LIREVKSATDGPLNVNFITFLATEHQIQVFIEETVAIGPSIGGIRHENS
jgi:hypothetical protein